MYSCTTEPRVPARVDARHGSGKGGSVRHVTQTSLQTQHTKQRISIDVTLLKTHRPACANLPYGRRSLAR